MVTSLLRSTGAMLLETLAERHVTNETAMALVASCDSALVENRGIYGITITLEQAILLGTKPSSLEGFKSVYTKRSLDDWAEQPLKPLAAAAFFAQEGDLVEAGKCLELRQRAITTHIAEKKWRDESAKTTWVLPHFPSIGLPEVEMCAVDSFLESGAFTLNSIEQCIGGHSDMYRWSLAKAAASRRPDLMAALQEHGLNKARKHMINGGRVQKEGGSIKHRVSYEDCAEMIRLCRVADANYLMSNVGGTKSVVGALYDSGDPGTYLRGLAVLAQGNELNDSALPYLIRAPTFEEISKFRGAGIVKLLHDMAWEYVEPLTTQVGFKGLLMPFVDRYEPNYLREVMVDHPKRIALKKNVYNVTEINIYNWDAVRSKLAERYKASIKFREDLVHETGDPIISWMFMLGVFDPRQSKRLDEVLKAHPNIRGIRKCLSTYELPISRKTSKTALAHI